MNPTHSYDIPAELIQQVIDNVDAPVDLTTPTRGNKFFRAESERLLYRSMTHKCGTIHFKFFSTILKKPRLASMVEVYHRHSDPHAQRRPLTTLIIRALPLMTNLKELVFGRDAVRLNMRGLPAFIGPKCSFQLEKLVAAEGYVGYDEIMITVLSSNLSRTLKSLHWPYSTHSFRALLTTNVIPQLTSFTGCLLLLKYLLPGRNIVSLKSTTDESAIRDMSYYQCVEAELGRVTSFCLTNHWEPGTNAHQFFQLMPALQTVEIRDLTLEEVPIFYNLPALRILIISVEDRQCWYKFTDQDENVLKIFTEFPLLEKFCVASDESCNIWTRSRDDGNPVGWSEVSYVRVDKPRGRLDHLEVIDPRAVGK